eukprot:CAMPEP_0116034578 /NCGR_PEP_ID=MMETSP0321-20121206/19708_1 /TAXON_ID=163516 /ORGANISM="Leptocylindrus danicus var. danicus, Strain B650" /LENGTH=108 /DNA_ID=CAMNT_0003510951 /DNA_START=112 /DNA_END=436 /DNA_ORIENTATION=+
MDGVSNQNDFQEVVENDRAHVWHHLSQHKKFETDDPLIIIEGKGMAFGTKRAVSILMLCLAAFGPLMWVMETIADAVRDQLVKMNFFGGTTGSIPGAMFSERLISKMP